MSQPPQHTTPPRPTDNLDDEEEDMEEEEDTGFQGEEDEEMDDDFAEEDDAEEDEEEDLEEEDDKEDVDNLANDDDDDLDEDEDDEDEQHGRKEPKRRKTSNKASSPSLAPTSQGLLVAGATFATGKAFGGLSAAQIWGSQSDADSFATLTRKRPRRRSRRRKSTRRYGRQIPAALQVMMGHANECFLKCNYDAAIETLNEVVVQAPRCSEPFQTLGLIYDIKGDKRNALQMYSKAAKLPPFDNESLRRVAVLSNELGAQRDAIQAYSKLIRRDGTDVTSLLDRAEIYSTIGAFQRACESYTQALEVDPTNTHARIQLALQFAKRGQSEKAIEMLKQVVLAVVSPIPSATDHLPTPKKSKNATNPDTATPGSGSRDEHPQRASADATEEESKLNDDLNSDAGSEARKLLREEKEQEELSSRLLAMRHLVEIFIEDKQYREALGYLIRCNKFLATGESADPTHQWSWQGSSEPETKFQAKPTPLDLFALFGIAKIRDKDVAGAQHCIATLVKSNASAMPELYVNIANALISLAGIANYRTARSIFECIENTCPEYNNHMFWLKYGKLLYVLNYQDANVGDVFVGKARGFFDRAHGLAEKALESIANRAYLNTRFKKKELNRLRHELNAIEAAKRSDSKDVEDDLFFLSEPSPLKRNRHDSQSSWSGTVSKPHAKGGDDSNRMRFTSQSKIVARDVMEDIVSTGESHQRNGRMDDYLAVVLPLFQCLFRNTDEFSEFFQSCVGAGMGGRQDAAPFKSKLGHGESSMLFSVLGEGKSVEIALSVSGLLIDRSKIGQAGNLLQRLVEFKSKKHSRFQNPILYNRVAVQLVKTFLLTNKIKLAVESLNQVANRITYHQNTIHSSMPITPIWEFINFLLGFQPFVVSDEKNYIQRMERLATASGNKSSTVAINFVIANYFMSCRNPVKALGKYFELFKSDKANPLLPLCISMCYSQMVQNRKAQNKYHFVAKMFAMLSEYAKLRKTQCEKDDRLTQTMGEIEVLYNFGRACHQVGLSHLAARYYHQVLDLDIQAGSPTEEQKAKTLSQRRDAAYNLTKIYSASGNRAMVVQIMKEHLTV